MSTQQQLSIVVACALTAAAIAMIKASRQMSDKIRETLLEDDSDAYRSFLDALTNRRHNDPEISRMQRRGIALLYWGGFIAVLVPFLLRFAFAW